MQNLEIQVIEQKPFNVDKYIKEKKISDENKHHICRDGTRSEFTKGDSCYSVYDKLGNR